MVEREGTLLDYIFCFDFLCCFFGVFSQSCFYRQVGKSKSFMESRFTNFCSISEFCIRRTCIIIATL